MISNLRISVTELVVWALLATAGLAWTVARVFDGIERAWNWLMRDRVAPLLEDGRPKGILCAGCAGFDHCDGVEGGCDCTCGWPEDWAEKPLPPERTWEQMTSHQLPVVGMSAAERKDWEHREGVRRRGAMRVEMTHRAHYAAMGFDYPSGLMARVRELAP